MFRVCQHRGMGVKPTASFPLSSQPALTLPIGTSTTIPTCRIERWSPTCITGLGHTGQGRRKMGGGGWLVIYIWKYVYIVLFRFSVLCICEPGSFSFLRAYFFSSHYFPLLFACSLSLPLSLFSCFGYIYFSIYLLYP